MAPTDRIAPQQAHQGGRMRAGRGLAGKLHCAGLWTLLVLAMAGSGWQEAQSLYWKTEA